MSDSTRPPLEDQIDRYARRELSAAEARELAQRSLDDSELFEDLTFTALANAALSAPSVQGPVAAAGFRCKSSSISPKGIPLDRCCCRGRPFGLDLFSTVASFPAEPAIAGTEPVSRNLRHPPAHTSPAVCS